jgi:acyl-CoA synthetase (AMP-forming)/AMP-acid ligase II
VDQTIISGGENIDPTEVEGVIASLPGVLDVFVLGLLDDEWGQIVVAAYVGAATPGDLSEAVKQKLTPAAVPKRWLQLDALPRNDLGKINPEALISLLKA